LSVAYNNWLLASHPDRSEAIPMTVSTLDSSKLESLLQSIDPRVRLIPLVWMRRLIRRDRNLVASARRAPHEHVYWISRIQLNNIVDLQALGFTQSLLPEQLLLLQQPREHSTLKEYWQLMFHAAIDHAVDDRFTPTIIESWESYLGNTKLHEIKETLRQIDRLFDLNDTREIIREWLAHWAELVYFQPDQIQWFYPSLPPIQEIQGRLLGQLDLQAIYLKTQPEGVTLESTAPKPAVAVSKVPVSDTLGMAGRAESEEKRGNLAMAFLLATFSGKEDLVHRIRDSFSHDLAHVLGIGSKESWNEELRSLASIIDDDPLSTSGRLIFELQAIIHSTTHKTFAIDPMGSLISRGRKKVNRELPEVGPIQTIRHLRKAIKLAEVLAIEKEVGLNLPDFLHEVSKEYEARQRTRLSEIIQGTLEEVGFRVENVPETIAKEKLVSELVDQLFERGFLRMSDLRDAIARSRIKLDDVPNPVRWVKGDSLLQANRMLDTKLDGIYRSGELYLRWLHRFSSLFFGTRSGRFTTLYFLLPFLGAFLLLEALQHMVEALEMVAGQITRESEIPNAFGSLAGGNMTFWVRHPQWHLPHWATLPRISIVAIGLFILFHVPASRRFLKRNVFWPLGDAVDWAWHSQMLKFYRQHLAVPIAASLVAMFAARLWGMDWSSTSILSVGVFLFFGTFFHTPIGRRLEERFDETVDRFWRIISVNFILGLIEIVLSFFQSVVGWIEWVLFQVDQALRHDESVSTLGYILKFTINLVWFWISYILRFAINLLIEPQINPIKHFPVVTVSHKLLLPMIPGLAKTFQMSNETMFTIVGGIPGIFGFLAWELKENWKLYRRNASATIDPIRVGSHGESLRGLLQPGFHSGEIPKTFSRIRAAILKDNRYQLQKQEIRLHHVMEVLHHHIDFELIEVLHRSSKWSSLPIEIDSIQLATNRIRVTLKLTDQFAGRIAFDIEERSGWLIAHLSDNHGLNRCTPDQVVAFKSTLTVLYKLFDVDLVREQLKAKFHGPAYDADASDTTVTWIVRKGHLKGFDYRDGTKLNIHERTTGQDWVNLQVDASAVILSQTNLMWSDWVESWQTSHAGSRVALIPNWHILPGELEAAKGIS
jgi:hypothetical protein